MSRRIHAVISRIAGAVPVFLCVFVFGSSAWARTSPQPVPRPLGTLLPEVDVQPDALQRSATPSSAPPRRPPPVSAYAESTGIAVEPAPLAAGAVAIDSTYYDLQDFGSLGQRIVVGADGRVHVTWEDDFCNVAGGCPPNPAAPNPYPWRGMGYAVRDSRGWNNLGRVSDPTIACTSFCTPEHEGGFGTLAVTANGRAVVSQHMNEDGCDLRSNLDFEGAAGMASWKAYLPPIVSPSYLFPQVALTGTSAIMLGEIPLSPPQGFYEEVTEFRVSRLVAEGPTFTCPTGWQMGAWNSVVSSSLFRDGHPAYPSLASGSDGRVGIAVTDFGGNVFLIESLAGTFLPGTITIRNLTNYYDTAINQPDSSSSEWRPWIHCHLAYQDTTPHVVWSELQARRINNQIEYFDWRSRIRHWSSTTGLSTVKQVQAGEADTYDDIDLGLHGPLPGFNTLSVDWPQVGFSPGGYETYVTWVRFTDDEVDPTAIVNGLEGIQTGTGYGDLCASLRRSGTSSWSAPENLTLTDRTDERFPALATYNPGGLIHLLYQSPATDQAGVAVVGDRGGDNCGPEGCRDFLLRRIAYLEKHLAASVVSVDETSAALVGPALVSYPNPARGAVRFSFDPARTPRGARAILVFSAAGRRIARVPASGTSARWDGRDDGGHSAPAGLYFARFEGDRGARATKFMLLQGPDIR